MATSSEYVIYRPEKLRVSDIFSFLVFGRSLEGSEVIESNSPRVYGSYKVDGVGGVNLITVITWILQKILIWISGPLALLQVVVEFVLNLLSLNGGLFKLFLHLFTGSLVIPNRDAANYRSILAHIDGRTDLNRVSTVLSHIPGMEPLNRVSEINPIDLTIMAAKIAYENKAFVEDAVTNHWKMHFVDHYQFYNEYLKTEDTQAFICCDRQENAQLIVVAFRGTEPFSGRDWSTDVDLSWMSMGEMGRVHIGFMKALGLQNEKDYKKGWPKDYNGPKKLAYYSLRDTLKALLQLNRGARIIITGHSLGGALAILFPSVLVLLGEEEIMNRVLGVYTFGQPRVGDKTFGNYMKEKLNGVFKRYHRVVFRYDIVPRIPFDDKISEFAHFGGCLYYRSWYKGKVMANEPDRNYFNLFYIPSKYLNALGDLIKAIFAGLRPGPDYKEGLVSILYRCLGLILPGIASHSPRDYVNAARLGNVLTSADYYNGEDEEEDDEDDYNEVPASKVINNYI